MLLEKDEQKKLIMYNDFIERIQKNAVPIRNGRHFERKKKVRSNKYPKSRRRAL